MTSTDAPAPAPAPAPDAPLPPLPDVLIHSAGKALPCLDLFTGVHGLGYALRGYAEPIQMCEWAPAPRACLKRLMAKGKIPTVPIHADIRTLDGTALKGRVGITIGGYPCPGHSSAGKRTGLEHEESGLWYEMLRVIKECESPFVLIENVGAILSSGCVSEICEGLGALGYTTTYCLLDAWTVGAPHKRTRWYALAYRSDLAGRVELTNTLGANGFAWHDYFPETHARLLRASDPGNDRASHTHRAAMLGNGVVPDAVRAAFVSLVTGFKVGVLDAVQRSSLKLELPRGSPGMAPADSCAKNRRTRGGVGNPMACGMYDPAQERWYSCAHPWDLPHEMPRDIGITLVPQLDVTDHKGHVPLTEPVRISQLPTLRKGTLGICRVLTQRNQRDLATTLKFASDTPEELRTAPDAHLNAAWLESHMFGLPEGWTEYK